MSIHRVARAVFGAGVPDPAGLSVRPGDRREGRHQLRVAPPGRRRDPDIPPRLGPVGGVWVRTSPANRFSFQAEGLFSEKGTHWDFSPDVTIEIRVRYVEIPLLARADVGAPASTTRVFVIGGVAPAFKLSARARSEFFGKKETRDPDRNIEPFDLGLVGGLGVEFGRGVIEARYTHSVLNINTDDNEPGDWLYNRVFSVTAGFRLR